MDHSKVKVTVSVATPWSRAKKMALQTIGKDMVNLPDDKWEEKMLMCQHSPIRMVEYDIKIENIPQWLSVHLVRHHVGVEKFVATQRDDRNPNIKDRDSLPQGELNTMTMVCNAEALINISRVRLCSAAHADTRKVWQKVKDAIADIDPIMARFMVRQCVYRGFCPEIKCCGICHTDQHWSEVARYRKGYANEDRFTPCND